MFDKNNRYRTRGVADIPIELQQFLWQRLDNLIAQGAQLDYLQVFELSVDRIDDIFFQRIEHRAEAPVPYKVTYNIYPTEMVDALIFIIDDGEYSTMLLAEEY